ncbi:hypothetical protein [Herbiconiux flava]|uniref:DUF3800 domain-containing protein n=1 Tax=Herbiconiux flava TaxID=881268 RepID=A0A852SB12_9MICO|nr:hypothetical protein [Herbiconiux flava]NYD69582.1 hypothetical protein [Herbiconiux flava]GLK16327.1 hypothetical protein GCM10017602_08090 [Herbiconiux flava]
MHVVYLKLDESVVNVCKTHQRCSRLGGSPSAECDWRWIIGVGVAVYESFQDLDDLRQRLDVVRAEILSRTGIEDAPRMAGFRSHGWHATKDGAEFAEPLLAELDRGATFKGHVRYLVSSVALDATKKNQAFDALFVSLLRVLMQRYRTWEQIDVVFEADQSPPSRYESIIAKARPGANVTVSAAPKGDAGLAMADYLLYATLKYVARVVECCQVQGCPVSHLPPNANSLTYSDEGGVQIEGHLTGGDYALRMYKTFVRNMSSVVEQGELLGQ